jgi:ligand-binding sensor domain-containing protein/signal transduction histidine kinase
MQCMSRRLVLRSLSVGALLVLTSVAARAVGEPSWRLRRYGVADGLVHERVNCALQDRLGYLWLGTWEGLSRFDGSEFQSYTAEQGLDNSMINALAEDHRGRLWVATNGGGVARRVDDPGEFARVGRRFVTYHVAAAREAGLIDVLLVDAQDRMWCATQAGLYRADLAGEDAPKFTLVEGAPSMAWADGSFEDRDGHAWFASTSEILECSADRVRHHPSPSSALLTALARGADGTLYAATSDALFRGVIGARGEPEWSRVALADVREAAIRTLAIAHDGTRWIGTSKGLLALDTTGQAQRLLPDADVHGALEDREGNVWAATWSAGACQLSRSAIRSWTVADGIPDRTVLRLIDDDGQRIVVSTGHGLAAIEGGVARALPGSIGTEFGSIGMGLLRGRDGAWWLACERGLARCPGPRLDLERIERVVCESKDACVVFGGLCEDNDGAILFGTSAGTVQRVDPTTRIAHPLALVSTTPLTAMREALRDSSGALWLAPYTGLFRVRAETVDDIALVCGLQNAAPRCFHEDEGGHLWIGTRTAGVWFTEDARAPRPSFRSVTTRDGLASDAVWAIAEDSARRLWLGTARGVARYDPATKRAVNFTQLDGLAGDVVQHVIVDAHDTVWAATSGGVSAIDALEPDAGSAAPPVYLTRIRVGGIERPIEDEGTLLAAPIELEAEQNDLEIEFRSPLFRGARELRWQHRLTNDDGAWSPPAAQRTLTFARLAPGEYQFAVRACSAEGTVGAVPARFGFTILRPVWQRAWFLALVALGLGLVLWIWHRSRLRRALALERVRNQIATDIHDELGSGLSQIAVLSEVARRGSSSIVSEHLNEIATLARAMRESVGEIVWAIDPRNDPASEFVRRLRQVAFNLFESEGTAVTFAAPDEVLLERIGLAPDRRRQLLLIAKEALSNIARHARAKNVTIRLTIEGDRLALTVRDDGGGFGASAEHRGNGLASLRGRARALGADLEIRSEPGTGTEIALSMPIEPPHVDAALRVKPPELG